MQVFPDFQDELQKLDSRLTVDKNPNYPHLANIKLDGVNICAIPSGEIKEAPDAGYTVTFANGFTSKHRSRPEALAVVNSTLTSLNTEEGKEIFFAKE
jgi:hypothetical protein